LVSAKGSHGFLADVAQQLAWLGAACRIRLPQFSTWSRNTLVYCDTNWTKEESSVNTFRISYNIMPLDDDEPFASWHSLVGEGCIATGFSIKEPVHNEKGLIVPQELLHTNEQQNYSDARFNEFIENTGIPRGLASWEEALKKHSEPLSHKVSRLSPTLRRVIEFSQNCRVRISSVNDTSFINSFKACIEDTTAFQWDWWPLMPRVPDLPSGKLRLRWEVMKPPAQKYDALLINSSISSVGSISMRRCYPRKPT
jgi:hypothetical protein